MKQTNTRMILTILFSTIAIFSGLTYFSKYRINIVVEEKPAGDIAIADESPMPDDQFTKEGKAHFDTALRLIKEKNFDNALKELDKAAELSPKTPVIYYWMGRVYLVKHEPEKAIAKYKKVLELDPNNYHALGQIGNTLALNKSKLEDAKKYLKKALAINNEYNDAHFELARIYAYEGDIKQSLSEFAFIFRTELRYADYHYELGKIFESGKKTDMAKREYERALQLNPKMTLAEEALKRLK